jgi:hypothetical protein
VDRINALAEEIMNTYEVDRTKVYLTGLSRGGFGAWEYGVSYPNKFAAVIPISARDVAGVERLAYSTVWIFHGDQDNGVPWQGSQYAYNRLSALNADVHFTLYEGVGHWAWEPAYDTDGLWVWMLNQSNPLADISDHSDITPDRVQLIQNYPNPFNPSTNIRYRVSELSNVSIEIVNIYGERIKTLITSEQKAGSSSVWWSGETDTGNMAPSGIYLTRIQTGKTGQTIKMTFLK